MGIYSVSVILISFGLHCCVLGAKQCGRSVCKAGQVCEENVGSGTCYDSSSRKDCPDGISYCYSPGHCCGVSTCCSKDSECCGLNACCPKGDICCGTGSIFCCARGTTCCGIDTCCAAGLDCDNGVCTSKSIGAYHWWYVILCVAVILSLIAGVVRRSRRRDILAARCPPAAGGAVLNVPIQSQEHYGYDQPINHAYPTTASAPLPPPYIETPGANVPISHPPPAYNDVVNPHA